MPKEHFATGRGAALRALVSMAPAAAALAQEASAPGTLVLEPVEVALASGGGAAAERGVLHVPLVRAEPEGAAIEVELYRFRAKESAPKDTPPVFLLHGGPGWPGLGGDLARRGFYEERIEPYLAIADLVVVGQRGIGSSAPDTECAGYEPFALDVDVGEEEENARLRAACAECKAHWEEQGYDLAGFNVLEAAADVDDARKALGYGKITLWGVSFGSHWSMAILRRFPGTVARAVLGGMEGPDHTYDMPGWVLAALERIAAVAEAAPAFAGRIPDGGLLAGFGRVIEEAEREPIEVVVDDPRTGAERAVLFTARRLRDMALGYTRRVSSRGGVPTWPADLIALHAGDFEAAALAALGNRDGGLPTASFFMLDCGSGISAERKAVLDADPAARIVGALGGFYDATCPVWQSDLGEGFRENFATEVPTLIVHGTWDTSTPFENALELVPFFEKGHLVVVNEGSHGALAEALEASPAFRDAVWEFLATGATEDLQDEIDLPPIEWVVGR